MDQETIAEVVAELGAKLRERFLGRIFQLSAVDYAFDFGLREGGFLFVSVDAARPRIYLIKRRARDLERLSLQPSAFAQSIKSRLGGGRLVSVTAAPNDRIVELSFLTTDELGDTQTSILIAQMTGRSANLFLLDSDRVITHHLRTLKGEGQQAGQLYQPPKQTKSVLEQTSLTRTTSGISAALDEHYTRLDTHQAVADLGATLQAKLQKEIAKRKKLQTNLKKDLTTHGDPAGHKRLGDLLLANITGAERDGSTVTLQDYYAEGAPTIRLQIDENDSLQVAAAKYFTRYTKSKRAVEEIGNRLKQIDRELEDLEQKRLKLEQAIVENDEAVLEQFAEAHKKRPAAIKQDKKAGSLPGMRRYLSSDGYEVLVGRTARDNDTLTFKVARPNDLWLHAGDYPGSHVVVRNSTRKDVPHRTIIEAAQLAAKFSQAGKDAKVTVHYTPRKFLAKPKGAASGLVRMSTFRTITVEPGENIKRR